MSPEEAYCQNGFGEFLRNKYESLKLDGESSLHLKGQRVLKKTLRQKSPVPKLSADSAYVWNRLEKRSPVWAMVGFLVEGEWPGVTRFHRRKALGMLRCLVAGMCSYHFRNHQSSRQGKPRDIFFFPTL